MDKVFIDGNFTFEYKDGMYPSYDVKCKGSWKGKVYFSKLRNEWFYNTPSHLSFEEMESVRWFIKKLNEDTRGKG